MATYTIIPCSNYHANDTDSLFALICNISDTDFIDKEVRFDISRLDVLDFFASLNRFEYSLNYRQCPCACRQSQSVWSCLYFPSFPFLILQSYNPITSFFSHDIFLISLWVEVKNCCPLTLLHESQNLQ